MPSGRFGNHCWIIGRAEARRTLPASWEVTTSISLTKHYDYQPYCSHTHTHTRSMSSITPALAHMSPLSCTLCSSERSRQTVRVQRIVPIGKCGAILTLYLKKKGRKKDWKQQPFGSAEAEVDVHQHDQHYLYDFTGTSELLPSDTLLQFPSESPCFFVVWTQQGVAQTWRWTSAYFGLKNFITSNCSFPTIQPVWPLSLCYCVLWRQLWVSVVGGHTVFEILSAAHLAPPTTAIVQVIQSRNRPSPLWHSIQLLGPQLRAWGR